jgi:hypothetical protein
MCRAQNNIPYYAGSRPRAIPKELPGGARALLARRVHGAPRAASMEDSWKPRLARVLLTLCSTRLTGPFVYSSSLVQMQETAAHLPLTVPSDAPIAQIAR